MHHGRPLTERHSFRMPFGTAVTIVLLMARHNLSQQVAGDLYGISQPTVSRIWRYLLALITAARAANELLAVFADTAYVKHTTLTPRPKKKDVPRTEADKEWNRKIASIGAPVERTVAHLKQWKILSTGYRGRLTELPRVIHIITNLEFYRQAR